jgi:hypothetical protein
MRRMIGAIAMVAALSCGSALTSSASAETAGTVHFVRAADSGFDSFTSSPTLEQQAWLRAHMWRMTAWSPYFDQKTSWYPQAWMYKDAYAIYKGSSLATQHPEWILKSASGEQLYIPYACSGGSCTQYAGDITSSSFRQHWIEEARSGLSHGYRGLFIDDVNMEERVGNGSGQQVTPVNASGQPIEASAWRAAMAQFMTEIRAAFPTAEIVHNAIWFADSDAGTSEPSIRREIEAANYIYLERGVNDSGLTGGTGPWSVNALFTFADQVHALGRSIVMAGTSSTASAMEYNLASYFLLSTGSDSVGSPGQTPTNWWSGWEVQLGEAAGPRYAWNNVLRRDFSGGLVLVNPPGSLTRTLTLPQPMRTIGGATVTTVTLAASSGVVLTGATGATPPPTTEPTTEPTPTPTQTEVEAKPVKTHGGGHSGGGSPKVSSSVLATTSAKHRKAHHAKHKARRHHRTKRRHHRSHSAHRGVATRISGKVRHATRGTVAIEIDRRVGRHWVVSRRVTTSVNARGLFSRLLSLKSAMRYRIRASYSGGGGYLPSQSKYRRVVLRVS